MMAVEGATGGGGGEWDHKEERNGKVEDEQTDERMDKIIIRVTGENLPRFAQSILMNNNMDNFNIHLVYPRAEPNGSPVGHVPYPSFGKKNLTYVCSSHLMYLFFICAHPRALCVSSALVVKAAFMLKIGVVITTMTLCSKKKSYS